MNTKSARLAFSIILLTFLSAYQPVFGAAYDPAFSWKQIETPHFYICFHQGEEKLARAAAGFIEDIGSKITGDLKHVPAFKTYIVLVDYADTVYGLSNAVYENIIVVPTLPPEEIMGTRYSNYLKMLLAHEYTHMVQMDMTSGIWNFNKFWVGRIACPNSFFPKWLLEGYAVYNETKYSDGGRGRDALFNMVARTAVIENKLPTLAQMSTYNYTPWPNGNSPYYFGYPLIKEIVDKYGEEKIKNLSWDFSGRLDLDLNASFRDTFGIDTKVLYENWQKETREKFIAENNSLIKQGLTTSEPITRSGAFNRFPKWSADNKSLVYVSFDFHDFPLLKSIDLATGKEVVLRRLPYVYSDIALATDGSIIYSQQKNYRQFYYVNDLYLYNSKNKTTRRLTYGQRAFDPCFSPDGTRVVFVENRHGTNQLKLLDITGQNIKTILAFEREVKISQPVFTPDGRRIIMAINQNGFQDIYLLNVDGTELAPIFTDVYADFSPCLSPDGRYIIFSSDRTSIYNLFAFSLKDRKLYQVTNSTTCAIFPSISPDSQKIAFVSYSSAGYDLQLMKYAEKSWKECSYRNENLPSAEAAVSNEYKILNYNPWPSLTPKFWIPWFFSQDEVGSQAGLLVFGGDAIGLHNYGASILYGAGSQRMAYSLQYINRQLYPDITFNLQDSANLSSSGGLSYWKRTQKTGVSFSFPWNVELPGEDKVATQSISLGYYLEGDSVVGTRDAAALGLLPAWKQNYLNLTWRLSNAEKYAFSNSYEKGRTWSVTLQKMLKDLGATYNSESVIVNLLNYFPLPFSHHSLGLRVAGAYSRGDLLSAFDLGGAGLEIPFLGMGNYFPLRGYAAASFSGNKIILGSFEYRFPFVYIENGHWNIPLFFRRLYGALFVDTGDAWTGSNSQMNLKTSCGAEILSSNDLFYYIPINLRLGTAYATTTQSWSCYFQFGSGF